MIDEPYARFPVLWRDGATWRLRVLAQQNIGGGYRWEDEERAPLNSEIDRQAKLLRAATEAIGPEAAAIVTRRKIPARVLRDEVHAVPAPVVVAPSPAPEPSAPPTPEPVEPACAAPVSLDERRHQLYLARRARQTAKRKLLAEQKREIRAAAEA